MAILFVFFSEPLVRILWSETWIKVAALLPYVGILILTQTLNSTTGNIFILLGKEKTLFRIGIPTSIAIILAIIGGAFISYVHVLIFYTIAIVCVDIPFVLYYGFKKTFGFSNKVILSFWIPKLGLSTVMIMSVWLDYLWITVLAAVIYLIHLLIKQRDDIGKTFGFILKKLRLGKLESSN